MGKLVFETADLEVTSAHIMQDRANGKVRYFVDHKNGKSFNVFDKDLDAITFAIKLQHRMDKK